MLRHYLERGLSKAQLARELGVSRWTIYHWIESGQLDRRLDGEPVRYGPRAPLAAGPEPVIRFETLPGQQGQVDFAEFRLPWGKRYALLVVLGYSRLLWLAFYPRQSMEVLMRGVGERVRLLRRGAGGGVL
ncbi:helix-turn-helix domain-containing protein [Arhodomonas sp. SL1]|uniref:helix-turn-helix domain-containing protein n=1 Tax=Arhodomonas sp. SL1 TaxID=3425691 RepID=UPI003F8823FC